MTTAAERALLKRSLAATTIGHVNGFAQDVADELEEETDSWHLVDLGPALRGEALEIIPTVLFREDNRALFYPGQVNGVHGDSGTGKSWVALRAAIEQIQAGYHAVWVDAEDPNERTIVTRLRAIGVPVNDILERFHYISPQSAATPTAMRRLLEIIADLQPTIVILDSVGELFGLEGLDENKDTDVGPWMRRVVRPIADLGPAVVLVDHSTKAADNPLHPSGSKRKRAAITGANYLVESTTPLSKEHGGRLKLSCAKDRHGAYARGEHVANIEVNVYPDDGLVIRVYPPTAKEITPDLDIIICARAAIAALKKANDSLPKSAVVEMMTVRKRLQTKRAGVDLAASRGFLRIDPAARGKELCSYISEWVDEPESADQEAF